jgi:hypothetical protein
LSDAEWVDIVESVPWSQSEASFWKWLEDHGVRSDDLTNDEIQSEILRGPSGTVVTWRLRRDALRRVTGQDW